MFRHQVPFLGDLLKRKYNMYLGASGTCSLNIFEGHMEAQGNMRRCATDGLERDMAVTIQCVLYPVGQGHSSNNPACTVSCWTGT